MSAASAGTTTVDLSAACGKGPAGTCGVLVDSGTTLLTLPKRVYEAVMAGIEAACPGCLDRAAEEAKAPEPAVASADESLKVHVELNGVQVYFKIKRTTRMQKVFSALATRQGVDVTSLRVAFRGARVGGLDTADMVGLRDGDRLDAEVIEPEPAPAPPVAPPPVRDAAPAAPVPADLLIVDSLIAVVSVALVAVVAHKYLAA